MYQLIKKNNLYGFTLIELVLVIIITGIIATVAIRKMNDTVETARYEQTKKELDQLSYAIIGNPMAYNNGNRTDFGYVGDIGALPPNLNALVQNPGGYSTWKGPYINRGNNDEFKKDGWNISYIYSDTLIRSTGSGDNIDKVFAINSSSLLSNTVEGFVVDANNDTPGSVFKDSLSIKLSYPDGVGNITTNAINPNAHGNFTFSNIPIGIHTLSVIYLPDSDTLSYQIMVNPNSTVRLDIVFPYDLW